MKIELSPLLEFLERECGVCGYRLDLSARVVVRRDVFRRCWEARLICQECGKDYTEAVKAEGLISGEPWRGRSMVGLKLKFHKR